jgi:uncharacterized protein YceK
MIIISQSKTKVVWIILIFMVVLSGCASQPIKREPQIETAPTGKARVYLYRDSDTARIRDVSILSNGNIVAILANRQYVSMLFDEGIHELKTKWAFDVSIPPTTYSLAAVSGEVSFLRLDIANQNTGITATGSPLVPILVNTQFTSRFISQKRLEASDTMSSCAAVDAK